MDQTYQLILCLLKNVLGALNAGGPQRRTMVACGDVLATLGYSVEELKKSLISQRVDQLAEMMTGEILESVSPDPEDTEEPESTKNTPPDVVTEADEQPAADNEDNPEGIPDDLPTSAVVDTSPILSTVAGISPDTVAVLAKGGVLTVANARNHPDLTQIKGVGAKRVNEVFSALEAMDALNA